MIGLNNKNKLESGYTPQLATGEAETLE